MCNKSETMLDHDHHHVEKLVLIRFDYSTILKKYYNIHRPGKEKVNL